VKQPESELEKAQRELADTQARLNYYRARTEVLGRQLAFFVQHGVSVTDQLKEFPV